MQKEKQEGVDAQPEVGLAWLLSIRHKDTHSMSVKQWHFRSCIAFCKANHIKPVSMSRGC